MKNSCYKISIFFLCFFLFQKSKAQTNDIELTNPSFEDSPKPSSPPEGSYSCGFHHQTAPDVHPLKLPLEKDKCYTFSIYLCRSNSYTSYLKGEPNKPVKFTTPIRLGIWGSNDFFCNKKELLAESDLVENTHWEKFNFYFTPKENIQYIILGTYFTSEEIPNGNILLDNASSFELTPCNGENKPNRERPDIIETRNMIKNLGELLKFRGNKFSSSEKLNLIEITKYIKPFTDCKLIFNFNGIKPDKAKLKEINLLKILEETELTSNNYEIINSTKKDSTVEWLIQKKKFCLGILKKI